jgi:hypothetical protein
MLQNLYRQPEHPAVCFAEDCETEDEDGANQWEALVSNNIN